MTLDELRDYIQTLGLDDNAKIVVLIGYDSVNAEFRVINVDANGSIKTVAG